MSWWKNSTIFPPGGSGRENGQYPGALPGDIPAWNPRFEYDFGVEVLAPDGNYYRAIQSHIASESFVSDVANWVIFAGPGINVAHNLATVLAVGNTTGGNDIIVSSGDDILMFDNAGGVGIASRLIWRPGVYIEYDFNGNGSFDIHGEGVGVYLYTNVNQYFSFESGASGRFVYSNQGAAITNRLDLSILTTASRTWDLPDQTGTIALTSDITGHDLTAVLNSGNITGPNDIVISSGQKISSSNGTAILELDAFSTANSIFMTTGAGATIKSDFYLDDGYIELTFDNGNSGLSITNGGAGTSIVKVHGTNRVELRSDDLRLIPGSGGNYSELDLSLISGSNKILTVPNATGTIALTSDFQTGQAYTPLNVLIDRSFDANSTTIDEIADVLGTLISDLQSVNIIS